MAPTWRSAGAECSTVEQRRPEKLDRRRLKDGCVRWCRSRVEQWWNWSHRYDGAVQCWHLKMDQFHGYTKWGKSVLAVSLVRLWQSGNSRNRSATVIWLAGWDLTALSAQLLDTVPSTVTVWLTGRHSKKTLKEYYAFGNKKIWVCLDLNKKTTRAQQKIQVWHDKATQLKLP